jgi:hypothetical protein
MIMTIRVPFLGGEKESLQASLDRHREAILWKLQGLDDEALRRPMTPSGTSLLGMVKHLGDCEYGWFCYTFGRPTEPGGDWSRYAALPDDNNDDNNEEEEEEEDGWLGPDDSTANVLAYYARARAAADQAIQELDLDQTGTAWFGDALSLRWALIHMLEDTARHAGHADILRELIDGTTGDHQRD